MENADVKSLLIDLEVSNITTGRKQEISVQRERLSEENNVYIVSHVICDSPDYDE